MRLRLASLAAALALAPTAAVLAQDDTTKPKLTGVSLAPSAFKPNAKGPTVARHGGTVVKFTVSEDANITLGVDRRTAAGTWKPYPGGENFDVKAGANRFRFSGRFNGVTLHPGRYRLGLIAADALGNASALVYRPFRIIR